MTTTTPTTTSKRTLARIDKQIEAIYYRVAQGVAINVMDIGAVFTAGRTAALHGGDVEAAIVGIVAQLRRN